jgi:ABC-type lipoprotein export system ATPase subunit
VDGTDPYSLSPGGRNAFRAGNIGFVFQEFHLIPYLTVLENILAASLASPRPDAGERARELVARFNLQKRMGHTPSQLSTGECQRSAMARALLNEPKLLLADEPTGNLDSDNAETVLKGLREFAEEGGGVLLVTHDREAAAHADRVLHMRDGKLEE